MNDDKNLEWAIDILSTFKLANNIIVIDNEEFKDVKQAIEIILQILKQIGEKCTTMENEAIIKDEVINMMAEDLKTPINGPGWIKMYYEHRALMKMGSEGK